MYTWILIYSLWYQYIVAVQVERVIRFTPSKKVLYRFAIINGKLIFKK